MLIDILESYPLTFENKKNIRIKNPIFLSSKSFLLIKNIMNDLVFIESNEENKKFEIIKRIIQKRKISSIIIQRNFRKFLVKKHLKTFLLIRNLLFKREKAALLIQNSLKNYNIKKHFKSLLKNDAIFLYDFPKDLLNSICILSISKDEFNKKINDKNLELSIQIYKPNLFLKFSYDKYLKCFYVPFKKIKLFKKRLTVNFIVNGEKIIDPRYSIINDSKGNFFNIINSFMIFKRLKQRSPIIKSNFKEPKIWEELFILKNHRKLSFDTSSLSSKTDISKEMEKNQNEYRPIYNRGNNNNKKKIVLQSILKSKKNNNNKINKSKIKKVSFRNEVEFLD